MGTELSATSRALAVNPRVRAPLREGLRREELVAFLEVLRQARAALAATDRREVAGEAEPREAEHPAGALELTARIGRAAELARRAECPTRALE